MTYEVHWSIWKEGEWIEDVWLYVSVENEDIFRSYLWNFDFFNATPLSVFVTAKNQRKFVFSPSTLVEFDQEDMHD